MLYLTYHSTWLSYHSKGDHTGAWKTRFSLAGESNCISVDEQEVSDDVLRIGAGRCRERSKKEAGGWDKKDSDLL